MGRGNLPDLLWMLGKTVQGLAVNGLHCKWLTFAVSGGTFTRNERKLLTLIVFPLQRKLHSGTQW